MHDKLIKRMWKANFWQLAIFLLPWLAVLSLGLNYAAVNPAQVELAFFWIPLVTVIMYLIAHVRFAYELNTRANPNKRKILFPAEGLMKHHYGRGGVCLLIACHLFLVAIPIISLITFTGLSAYYSLQSIHFSWIMLCYFSWTATCIVSRSLLVRAIVGRAWNRPSAGMAAALGALIVLPFAAYLWLVSGNIELEKRLHAEFAAGKAQGRIASLEDALALPQFNHPSPIKDAVAQLSVAIDNELYELDLPSELTLLNSGAADDDDWSRVATALQNSPETIALIGEITVHSEGSFEHDFTWEKPSPPPQLSAFRDASRINSLRMLIAARNGDSDAAFAYWRGNLNLQQQLSDDFFMISFLNLVHVNSGILRALNRSIDMGASSEAQLMEIAEDLQSLEPILQSAAELAFNFERLAGYYMFWSDDVREEFPFVDTSYLLGKLIAPVVLRVVSATALDRIESIEQLFDAGKIVEPYRLKTTLTSSFDDLKFYQQLVGFTPYWRWHALYGDMLARMRATRVLIAAELFRRNTGEFPRCQQELVPEYLAELPIDPHTGAPLIYEFTTLDIPISEGLDAPAQVLSARSAGADKYHREPFMVYTGRGAIRVIDIVK